MSLSTIDDVIDAILPLMDSSVSSLPRESLEAAAEHAVAETGWAFPVSDGIKGFWLLERTRRHILQILANVASMKFQYKQIHLEHRFKHLIQLIKKLDEDFVAFVDRNPGLFPGMDLDADDISGFISYISNGFTYDVVGIEL